MTTATNNNLTPEPDTQPDAVRPPAPPKADEKVSDVKTTLNTTNVLLGMAVAVILILSGYTAIAVRFAQTEQRSIETATKADKAEAVASDVAVIKVKISYMEQAAAQYREESTKKMEQIAQDVRQLVGRK